MFRLGIGRLIVALRRGAVVMVILMLSLCLTITALIAGALWFASSKSPFFRSGAIKVFVSAATSLFILGWGVPFMMAFGFMPASMSTNLSWVMSLRLFATPICHG